MREFFFEIYSEEIPARMQAKAQIQLKNLLESILKAKMIRHQKIHSFITPNRLVGYIKNLEELSEELKQTQKGPSSSSDSSIIERFKKAHTSDSYESRFYEEKGYHFVEKTYTREKTVDLIPSIIDEILEKFVWIKSMRWPEASISWVRPIRRLFCFYQGKALSFEITKLGIKSTDSISGHCFMSPKSFIPGSFKDYVDKLEANFVILDFEKRKQMIENQLNSLSDDLIPNLDKELLDETAGLCEYPYVHLGKIDQEFMHLPEVVLQTTSKFHQKYFSFKNKAPYFGAVCNIDPKNPDTMLRGYERVLRARLNDADFFFQVDTKTKLIELLPKLDNVTFHKSLGSIGHKVQRLRFLTLSEKTKHASLLCKIDLVTQMVGEFPELQGKMGKIYALVQKEDSEIADAIEEHYLPEGPNSECPKTETGRALSLIDKVDSLVGLLGVGTKVSGSKDPFGLRRIAVGIIRLYRECFIKRDFIELIDQILEAYQSQNFKLDSKVQTIEFIKTRLFALLKDEGIDEKIIRACLDTPLHLFFERLKQTIALANSNEGMKFLNAYKRVWRILKEAPNLKLDEMNFSHPTEKKILQFLLQQEPLSHIDQFLNLANDLENYFNEVKILEGNLIQERLTLLSKFCLKIENFIKISHLIN